MMDQMGRADAARCGHECDEVNQSVPPISRPESQLALTGRADAFPSPAVSGDPGLTRHNRATHFEVREREAMRTNDVQR